MKQKFYLSVVVILGLGLFFNNSMAQEEHAHKQETTPTPNTPTKPVAPPKKSLLGKIPVLENTVNQYVQAWQQRDYKTMRTLESWEGGEEVGEIEYIQSFSAKFHIGQWKITKIDAVGNDEYKLLVWLTHSPPAQVAAYVPANTMVRSTIVQWWKKQGEQFVHLFHLERQRLMEMTPMMQPPPAKPKSEAETPTSEPDDSSQSQQIEDNK